MKNIPKEIVLHCTDVSKRDVKDQFASVNAYHRGQGYLRSTLGIFVGYHRLITGGKNYKCKEDWEEGCHCKELYADGSSMNIRSLGICVGFDGDIELVDPEEYRLLQKQVWDWQDQYLISSDGVKFHNFYSRGKTCPGSLLDRRWLLALLDRSGAQPTLTPSPVEKPGVQCEKQEAIIEMQNKSLSLYDQLVQLLLKLK